MLRPEVDEGSLEHWSRLKKQTLHTYTQAHTHMHAHTH